MDTMIYYIDYLYKFNKPNSKADNIYSEIYYRWKFVNPNPKLYMGISQREIDSIKLSSEFISKFYELFEIEDYKIKHRIFEVIFYNFFTREFIAFFWIIHKNPTYLNRYIKLYSEIIVNSFKIIVDKYKTVNPKPNFGRILILPRYKLGEDKHFTILTFFEHIVSRFSIINIEEYILIEGDISFLDINAIFQWFEVLNPILENFYQQNIIKIQPRFTKVLRNFNKNIVNFILNHDKFKYFTTQQRDIKYDKEYYTAKIFEKEDLYNLLIFYSIEEKKLWR